MTAGPVGRLTGWSREALADPLLDLFLGLRLAAGGGRRGWVRPALVAVGTAVGVSVLLLAASVPAALAAHERRAWATEGPVPDGAPADVLYLQTRDDAFRGVPFQVRYVEAGGPHAPVPPGLPRIPRPGEIGVSAAMARLLAAPDAGLLRERLRTPARALTVADDALSAPTDRLLYVGATGLPHDDAVVRFVPAQPDGRTLTPLLWALLVVGVVVLLAPVVVFTAISARLSGAERDRTLAAVRLVGCSIAGTRRVAAGESLAGALVGVGLGAAGFLAVRPLAERQSLVGVTPFAADLVPSWPLVALVAVGVPALAVVTTTLALRRTLIEPLGVTRQAASTRRRLWWRLLVPLAGAAVLGTLIITGLGGGTDGLRVPLVAGVVLVLLGVPALLPWVLDRALRSGWHRTPALQLATGRLRAEGGTPARVVAGLGVVLAGAIGMSSILAAASRTYRVDDLGGPPVATVQMVEGAAGVLERPAAELATVTGVRSAAVLSRYTLVDDGTGTVVDLTVVPCPTLRALLDLPICRDGAVYAVPGSAADEVLGSGGGGGGRHAHVVGPRADPAAGPGVPAVLPAATALRPSLAAAALGAVVVTPGVLPDVTRLVPEPVLTVRYDPAVADVEDRIRLAVAPLAWRARTSTQAQVALTTDQDRFDGIRRGLLAGSLLTLALAAATMVVAALEQIRERRRPLAALAAAGVPRTLLARSLLWQNAVPLVLAVVVADVLGCVLGALILRLVGEPVVVDGAGVATYSGVAVLAAGLATVLTLPAVTRATRPAGLRAE